MAEAYLGLGSNVDARANIASGIDALQAEFGQVAVSPLYRSPAAGFEGNDFINAVARIETDMSPLQLKHSLQAIEDRHGRARNVPKFSDRTLDIDILVYGDLWLRSPELEIPRAEILTAAYVLKPLTDLAPDLPHPVEGLTMAELWANFPAGKKTIGRIG